MSGRHLLLLPGDVPAASAGAGPPVRLEVEPGTVRRVVADRVQEVDVTGCTVRPAVHEGLDPTRPVGFVDRSGQVRLRVDVLDWMPGAGRDAPGAREWAERVVDELSRVSGARRDPTVVAAQGPLAAPVDEAAARRQNARLLALAVAAVVVSTAGLWAGLDPLLCAGGLFAVALVLAAGVPRRWWPARTPPTTWRIRLAAPAGVRPGWVGASPDLPGALILETADGRRRWVPASGPAAAEVVRVAGDGTVLLRTPAAAEDLTPHDAADLPGLLEGLRAAGLPVEQAGRLTPPPVRARPPSGAVGDAQPVTGASLGALAAATAAGAHGSGAATWAVGPFVAAGLLGLVGALSAGRTALALRTGR